MDKKMKNGGAVGTNVLKAKKERNMSLDIIRIISFGMVVYTHFFMYTGYYKLELVGSKMLLMTVIRSYGIVCIPMFIFMTGYLMKGKQLNARYYSGIRNILLTYFFASGLCYLFDCAHAKEPVKATLNGFIEGLLSFSSAKYSWYIEMYIGLFLLIPFLNIIWNNLPEKKHRIILIVSLVFLTVAPQLLNTFIFDVEGWWQQPMMSDEYMLILPVWWQKIFPLTYYFTGCYIKEYGIKINKWLNLVLVILSAFLFGAYNYYRSTPGILVRGEWQNNASPIVYISGILLFVFILNLNIKIRIKWLSKVVSHMAELTLGAFLVSCIFDVAIYDNLKESLNSQTIDFRYLWVTAPFIMILSLITAFVINLASKLVLRTEDGIVWCANKLVSLVKKDKAPVPKAPVRPAPKRKPANPKAPAGNTAPVRRPAPSAPAAVKPMPSPDVVYKKRVNTMDDDAEEVIIVVEDKEYSAPAYR